MLSMIEQRCPFDSILVFIDTQNRTHLAPGYYEIISNAQCTKISRLNLT